MPEGGRGKKRLQKKRGIEGKEREETPRLLFFLYLSFNTSTPRLLRGATREKGEREISGEKGKKGRGPLLCRAFSLLLLPSY